MSIPWSYILIYSPLGESAPAGFIWCVIYRFICAQNKTKWNNHFCYKFVHANFQNWLFIAYEQTLLLLFRVGEEDTGSATRREKDSGLPWGWPCSGRLVPGACRPTAESKWGLLGFLYRGAFLSFCLVAWYVSFSFLMLFSLLFNTSVIYFSFVVNSHQITLTWALISMQKISTLLWSAWCYKAFICHQLHHYFENCPGFRFHLKYNNKTVNLYSAIDMVPTGEGLPEPDLMACRIVV